MEGTNLVILTGTVGKDAEYRVIGESSRVANFSLATNETYKNKNGEKVTTTEWHNIVAWNALADFSNNYIKKGTNLYIEGKIKTETYQDQNGATRYATKIVANTIKFLPSGVKHEESEYHEQNAPDPQQTYQQPTAQPQRTVQQPTGNARTTVPNAQRSRVQSAAAPQRTTTQQRPPQQNRYQQPATAPVPTYNPSDDAGMPMSDEDFQSDFSGSDDDLPF